MDEARITAALPVTVITDPSIMDSFTSIVRFRAEDGNTYYGEAGASLNHTQENLVGRIVPVFEGLHPWDDDFVLTESRRKVVEVLVSLCISEGEC